MFMKDNENHERIWINLNLAYKQGLLFEKIRESDKFKVE